MKIMLKEAAKPFSKVKRNVDKILIPSLEEMGFSFDLNRTLEKNKYEYIYYGYYNDYNNNNHPCVLFINTTHKGITDPEDIFVTMSMDGKVLPLGSLNSKDKSAIQDYMDDTMKEEIDMSKPKDTNRSGLISSPDGSEEHTLEEWLKIVEDKSKKLDNFIFGQYVNNKVPSEVFDYFTNKNIEQQEYKSNKF